MYRTYTGYWREGESKGEREGGREKKSERAREGAGGRGIND